MRAFFALDVPEAEKAKLGAWQRHQARDWKWTRPEGLHLTLAFLGEIGPGAAVAAARVGAAAGAGRRPFLLRAEGLGAFPCMERARVLWLGLDPSPDLKALVTTLRAGLHKEGLLFDDKSFKAHLTLARFDLPAALPRLPPPSPFAWEVGALCLMESVGGRYETRERWAMA
jgi:2'-5' RNA ligase